MGTDLRPIKNDDVAYVLARGKRDHGSGIVSYLRDADGATVRSVQAKLDEWVSVKDFGAAGDDAQDDTAAIQAALNYLTAQGGGVLLFPPGKYKTTSTISYSDSASYKYSIYGHNARIRYYGSGYALDFKSTATGIWVQYPYLSIVGLNIRNASSGAATGGLRLQNMNGAWLENVYVGYFPYNYTFENNAGLWSENITMMHCGAVGAGTTHIRFIKTGTGENSFARFNVYSLFVGNATYCFHVALGCDVYDSSFKNINGNFTGTALFYLEGGMEGSVVDGIFTESGTGVTGLVKLRDPATVKSPILMNIGNYVNASAAPTPWLDNSNASTWPTLAAGVQLFSPLVGRGANINLEWYPKDDSLQTPANFEKLLETVTGLEITTTEPTTYTTTAAIWASASGACGRVILRVVDTYGAGRTVCEVSFASAGATVTQNVIFLHKATRPTYYNPTIDTVVINTDGTVSFNYYLEAGAPSSTVNVTIAVMI